MSYEPSKRTLTITVLNNEFRKLQFEPDYRPICADDNTIDNIIDSGLIFLPIIIQKCPNLACFALVGISARGTTFWVFFSIIL